MNFPGKRHPSLLSPLALGIAGACAVLLAGDWSLRATGLAAALAIAGVFLARRNAGAHRAQRLMLENYLAGQQDFGVKVVPVWAGHVETARAQMDSAVEVHAMRFSAIVDRLEQAVHVTNLSTQSIDGADNGLVAVLAESEQRLAAVAATQSSAMHSSCWPA